MLSMLLWYNDHHRETEDVQNLFHKKLRYHAIRLSHRRMNACQSPKIVFHASVLLAERSSGRAITPWIGCLCQSSCAWYAVWSAAAWLPQQPYPRSGVCHTVDHADHGDAGCARYDHRVGQEWDNSWQTFFETGSIIKSGLIEIITRDHTITPAATRLQRRRTVCSLHKPA